MSWPHHGAIDCDIHPAVPSTKVLLPYLDEYWREAVVQREIDRLELAGYPSNAPHAGRPDWRPATAKPGSSLSLMQDQALDHFNLRYAICNVIYGAQAVYNDHLGAALCRAINDWMIAEWLDRDPRLRASIVVTLADPERAAEEIERLAGDRRFVQVLMLAITDVPLGRKYHWPIYRAAEKYGLPIGVHAGSMGRHSPTQSGYLSTLAEDYVLHAQGFATQVVSLVAEGVFQKFPALKFVLIESGVAWLPSLMWRFSKDWRGVRTEVPWLAEPPAKIIREHFRLTIQPLDAPADPLELERLLDHLGSDDMLLFSTDYPHWQFDGDAALPSGLPDRLLHKILVENPLATYPRLTEETP